MVFAFIDIVGVGELVPLFENLISCIKFSNKLMPGN